MPKYLKEKLQYLSNVFKSKEVKDKIFFSFFILVIFRLLSTIPVVGVPASAFKDLFSGSAFGDTLNTLSGGVLETASVVAIGLTPYINASIIIQLLSTVIPKLEDLRKEGSQGNKIISMYTRYLTFPLAILQAFVIYSTLRGFGLIGKLEPIDLATMIATLTAGALFMMWLGELVTEMGISNGSSYLIFVGIVAGIPGTIRGNIRTADGLELLIYGVILVLIVLFVVVINNAERRLKVTYSRRVREGTAQDNYFPIKLTQFGVLPVIFAISFISFPQLLAEFLKTRDINDDVTRVSEQVISTLRDVSIHNIALFILVILFSFFYVSVMFNAKEHAENLQKQGAFIPEVRPGAQTEQYLKNVALRLTAFGSVCLALLAVLPAIFVALRIVDSTFISGTSLLILVSVVLEIRRKIESLVVVKSYDRYL